MSPIDFDALQARFQALFADAPAPGAVLAVLDGDELHECALGVANLDTGVPMTTDTIFEIASVTKVYNATLAMQLADDGLLDLDAPIRTYLPQFRLADEHAAATVTARHLAAHTSGIDGDKLDDYGRGDDAIERYVDACATLEQVHPVGATQSYSNSGMVILGRVIEVLTGRPWIAALRDRLLDPLGLELTHVLPEDLAWRRLAAPHVGGPDGPRVLYLWDNVRSIDPCGGISAAARDVLAFARLHLDGGVASDGRRLLSAASAAEMVAPQVALPNPYDGATHWGLGWKLTLSDGGPLVATHGGANYGHHARLVAVPERGVAAVVLANGPGIQDIAAPLLDEVLAAAGAATTTPPPVPAAPPAVDLAAHAGVYETLVFRLELAPADGRLDGTLTFIGPSADQLPPDQLVQRLALTAVEPDLFVTQMPGSDSMTACVFYASDGRRYAHVGGRAFTRR